MTEPAPTSPPSLPSREERLLVIVRGLARELRRGADDVARFGLDHALERDFGLDSLARVELLARIEAEMGVRLAEEAIAGAETPRDLLSQMLAASGEVPATAEKLPGVAPALIEASPAELATLTAILDWHVARHGDWVHITLLGEGGRSQDIDYRTLRREAQALAAGLLKLGLGKGERVAIMLPTCREFFAAFYGALYAGCVPVPLYPPARPSQLEEHMRRIAGILANAQAALLIADSRTKPLGHLLRARCSDLHGVTTAEDLSCHGLPSALPALNSQDIAFLQYTSGSTGNPKGVVLTHANLLANLRAMERASGIVSGDVFVSWLPLYHDMGLIGACMGSLHIGFRLVLLSPLAFLARPANWLWAIHRYRATVSAAPNFAYALCAAKVDDRQVEELDLSSWRLAYNGAEPVSPDTLDGFVARFAAHGFRREALTPVYGLAENSVGLAFPPPGRGPLIDRVERKGVAEEGVARRAAPDDRHALRVVSCGAPLPAHQIRIVDPSGQLLPERGVGRVQFRGPSATAGYYRNPEASARLYDGDWLNSGDLGYLAAGELYLTGREKDIIIRGGHNVYPAELEEAVGNLRGIRKGGVAVFPASDPRSGTERLVVLAETRERDAAERRRLCDEINGLAVDLAGMPADDIVLAPPRSVLKTSSGKVRRAACRELYENDGLRAARRAPWVQLLRWGWSSAGPGVLRLLREGADALWAAWAWTVFVAVVPVAWLLIVVAPGLVLRRRIARNSARLALALAGLTPRVAGREHLAAGDPCIVAANHASYLDALLLSAVLPPRFAFVAKQELLRKPLAAIPLRRLGCVFVERFDSARGAEDTRALEERARSGDSLVFFAEGTFRSALGLLPFRMGAFAVAARTGLPVIPLALNGTRVLLRGEERRPHFSRLRVQIGAPATAPGSDWQAALRLRDSMRLWIAERVDEPDAAG